MFLPHQPVDHDCREPCLGHGDQAYDYYLRINPSAARSHQRTASLRALRLLPR